MSDVKVEFKEGGLYIDGNRVCDYVLDSEPEPKFGIMDRCLSGIGFAASAFAEFVVGCAMFSATAPRTYTVTVGKYDRVIVKHK